MRQIQLILVYLRIGVMNELQYHANLALQVLQSALWLLAALAGVAVVFAHTDTLNGWRESELIALLGVYFIILGAINVVIQPSMQRFLEDMRTGTLDFVFVKPEDAQLIVSVREVNIWKLADIGLGVGVLGLALPRLGAGLGAAQAAAFVLTLLCGAAAVYSFWLILATTAFWFVRIENILVVFTSLYAAGRWPVGIYPPSMRAGLTFLVPIAIATTTPAEALTGRLTGQGLLGAALLSLALVALSRRFWLFGMRHYAGASA